MTEVSDLKRLVDALRVSIEAEWNEMVFDVDVLGSLNKRVREADFEHHLARPFQVIGLGLKAFIDELFDLIPGLTTNFLSSEMSATIDKFVLPESRKNAIHSANLTQKHGVMKKLNMKQYIIQMNDSQIGEYKLVWVSRVCLYTLCYRLPLTIVKSDARKIRLPDMMECVFERLKAMKLITAYPKVEGKLTSRPNFFIGFFMVKAVVSYDYLLMVALLARKKNKYLDTERLEEECIEYVHNTWRKDVRSLLKDNETLFYTKYVLPLAMILIDHLTPKRQKKRKAQTLSNPPESKRAKTKPKTKRSATTVGPHEIRYKENGPIESCIVHGGAGFMIVIDQPDASTFKIWVQKVHNRCVNAYGYQPLTFCPTVLLFCSVLQCYKVRARFAKNGYLRANRKA